MRKPALERAVVVDVVGSVLDERPVAVEPMVEGVESQAFRVMTDSRALVLRINPSTRGFEKDRWAHTAAGDRVPVPAVVDIGWIDSEHAYCLTDWAPGTTLEELGRDAAAFADAVVGAWRRLGEIDVSSVRGFGDFAADGEAPAATWHEVLAATLERSGDALVAAAREGTLPDPSAVLLEYARLIDACPNERALIHGDFGSNNVLADGGAITAIVDWENAMVGDPLYDVANTFFWATHLECMRVQADRFAGALADVAAFRERVLCYGLAIGLAEAFEAVFEDVALARWALGRCGDLVGELPAPGVAD